MKLQRNLVMKNLGIVLWKLRYPIILTNNIPIQLLNNIRLLVISDLPIPLGDAFVKDVIHTMHLNLIEVHMLTVDQMNTLILPSSKFLNYCWWIGIKVLCDFNCITLNTPSLLILKRDISAKRNLWNQITAFHIVN